MMQNAGYVPQYTIFESKKYRLVFFFIAGLVWAVFYFISINVFNNPKLWGCAFTAYLILLIGSLLFRSMYARNSLYFVIFLFMSLYVVPVKLYFFNGIYLSAHNLSYTYTSAAYTTLLLSLFFLGINVFVKIPKYTTCKLKYKSNNVIFYALFVMSLIGTIAFRKQGNIYAGEANTSSSTNEYLFIFYLLCYLYTNGNKYKLRLCYLLYALYSFFIIISGARIEVVMLSFMLLAIKFQFDFSFRKISMVSLIGVWLMSLIGVVRHNPMSIINMNIIDIIIPFQNSELVQSSNEGDVFWASERLIIFINDGVITLHSRIICAIYYVFSVVIPSSLRSPVTNLANYRSDILTTGGGGLAPIYYYVMFGLLGIVILSLIVVKSLKSLSYKGHYTMKIYAILVITTLPRWFAYNPIHFVKYCIIGVLVYMFVASIDYTMKRCNHSIKNAI